MLLTRLVQAAIAALALVASPVSAQQVLKVGSTPTGVPFTFLDTKTNSIQGIMVDLITEIGKDAGVLAGVGELGVPLAAKLSGDVDAVIDFSVPEATDEVLELCMSRGIALVMATTGHSEAQKERLRAAAKKIALVWAPSMSMAVNVTMKPIALAIAKPAAAKAPSALLATSEDCSTSAAASTAVLISQSAKIAAVAAMP